jgi:hypothetical protein
MDHLGGSNVALIIHFSVNLYGEVSAVFRLWPWAGMGGAYIQDNGDSQLCGAKPYSWILNYYKLGIDKCDT